MLSIGTAPTTPPPLNPISPETRCVSADVVCMPADAACLQARYLLQVPAPFRSPRPSSLPPFHRKPGVRAPVSPLRPRPPRPVLEFAVSGQHAFRSPASHLHRRAAIRSLLSGVLRLIGVPPFRIVSMFPLPISFLLLFHRKPGVFVREVRLRDRLFTLPAVIVTDSLVTSTRSSFHRKLGVFPRSLVTRLRRVERSHTTFTSFSQVVKRESRPSGRPDRQR